MAAYHFTWLGCFFDERQAFYLSNATMAVFDFQLVPYTCSTGKGLWRLRILRTSSSQLPAGAEVLSTGVAGRVLEPENSVDRAIAARRRGLDVRRVKVSLT